MSSAIIAAIILVVVFLALRPTIKHMKGQGSCCGGGNSVSPAMKKEIGDVVAVKVMTIEGMHCVNCKNSVEQKINALKGASASVDLQTQTAIVKMDREISDEELTKVVERLDFKVVKIETK